MVEDLFFFFLKKVELQFLVTLLSFSCKPCKGGCRSFTCQFRVRFIPVTECTPPPPGHTCDPAWSTFLFSPWLSKHGRAVTFLTPHVSPVHCGRTLYQPKKKMSSEESGTKCSELCTNELDVRQKCIFKGGRVWN